MATDDIESSGQSKLGIIGTIITSFLGLMVLWMGVRAAFNSSDITKKFMKPLEGMLKMTESLPQYMPIPGIGSIAGLGQANKMLS